MVKALFRNIKNYLDSKRHEPTSKSNLADEVQEKPLPHENKSTPPQEQNPSVRTTTTVKDMKTGEYSQAEIIDGEGEKGIEKIPNAPENPASQIDQVKLRARNEAYIKAVKGLMVMKLDPDIFTDAMDELREKYYGDGGLPDEVATVVENLTQKVNVKQ